MGLIVPQECVAQDESGVEELRDGGDCASLPVRGELIGGGTTAAGRRLVFIRIDGSNRCFESLAIGDRWPLDAGACAGE